MKNKVIVIFLGLIFVAVIVLSFILNNNENNDKKNETDNKEEKSEEIVFPYTDDNGMVRYKLVINGKEVETKNLPFKLKEDDIGSYYPIKDILDYFKVATLISEDNKILTTKINGNIIRVDADQGKMKYGKTTLEALDGNIKTILIDNVLYVPSFFFMNFSDNSIVDYSVDNTAATLSTDLVIDSKNSGISGLSLSETNSNGGKVNNGYHICSACGGAGGSNVAYFDQYLVGGRYVQVTKYRWETCSVCGGTGHVH